MGDAEKAPEAPAAEAPAAATEAPAAPAAEAPAAAAPEPAAPAEKTVPPTGAPGQNPDVWKAVAMADHFEKIQKLPEKLDGVPNFRRTPGYKVWCSGQPTKAGFVKAVEKACGEKYPKDGPIIWINMRQEPIIYINGDPVCARPPNKIGEYAELGAVTREYWPNLE